MMAPREPNPSTSRGRIGPVSMQVLRPTRPPSRPPSKMSLPIGLLEQIVDYLPVQTQLRFARTNHTMRDLIYDDTRWVSKLKAMGVWNEEEARRAAEEEINQRREAIQRAKQEAVLGRSITNGATTLFDADVEGRIIGALAVTPFKTGVGLLDDTPEAFGEFQSVSSAAEKPVDTFSPLRVLSSVLSRRGQARSEFGKVYATLAPLYIDLANSNSIDDAAIFRHRRQPEEQAKLLKVLERFGRAKAVDEWTRCQKRIRWITEAFERQILTDFEKCVFISRQD